MSDDPGCLTCGRTTSSCPPCRDALGIPSDAYDDGRTRTIHIEIIGHPTPQGSKRAWVQNGRAMLAEQTGDRLRAWRQDVKAAAIDVRPPEPVDQPVQVAIEFRFPRPKAHFRTGANAHLLRDNAPIVPASRATGDIEKLIRSTHDALTAAGIWTDDCLVASITADKCYADTTREVGATVWIEEIT